MFKKQEGITLVALVVTIIVLLILAGVSISMILGNNGILNQAERAVSGTAQGRAEEAVAMALASLEAEFYENKSQGGPTTRAYTFDDLEDNLGGGAKLESGQSGDLEDGTVVKILLDDSTTAINVTLKAASDDPTLEDILVVSPKK